MTTDLAEYRQADLDPYNECRMMDAERRKNEKANEKDYSTFDGSGMPVHSRKKSSTEHSRSQ